MPQLFFSVIMPTYNRADFLKIAINSVLAQSFKDYELIIIDDGSTDDTKTIAGKNQNINYVYQAHQGVAKARNTGISKAGGRFICFLDSDDRFREDKLKVTHDYIMKHPDYAVFHTEEIWYRKGRILEQKIHHKKPTGYVFENAVKLCSISISTAAIKKDLFSEVGMFDESMPACEDYDFWLRVTHKYPAFLIPEYLTIKEGGHLDQQSFKYPAMDRFRIYALKKIIESKVLNKENLNIAICELRKKCDIYINGALKRGKNEEVDTYKKILRELR